MPQRAFLPLLLLTILLMAPMVLAATPSRGPFAGVVARGATQQHPYTNWERPDFACPAYPWGPTQLYEVTLTYEPAVDRVDVAFLGLRAVGSNGVARMVFEAPDCIAGTISVLGVSTAGPYAAYQVSVVGLNYVKS